MREIIKYIILGMIQGFSEPLPISSSGHLIIFENILNLHFQDFTFEIIVNMGSLIAILIYYQQDLIALVKNNYQYLFKKNKTYQNDFNYLIYLIIATIPASIVGYFFIDYITHFKNLLAVGASLIITAIALFIINTKASKNHKTLIDSQTALTMGLAQIIALAPGISRSGATTIAGLFKGNKIDSALKFSFFMYIPISVASFGLSLFKLKTSHINYLGLALSFIASLITTYIGITFLLKIVRKARLNYFGYYCLTVGTLIIIYYLFH